jgi:hypothetical protein
MILIICVWHFLALLPNEKLTCATWWPSIAPSYPRKILNSHLFWLNSHPFFVRSIICRLNLSVFAPPPLNNTRNAIGDGVRDMARANRRSQQQLRIRRSGPHHQNKQGEAGGHELWPRQGVRQHVELDGWNSLKGDAHEVNWLWVWNCLLVGEGCLGSP